MITIIFILLLILFL